MILYTLLFKIEVVYFLSSQSSMIIYTLSHDVLISFRPHPVASVTCPFVTSYVIHPHFSCVCSIILTSTPRRNCIREMGCRVNLQQSSPTQEPLWHSTASLSLLRSSSLCYHQRRIFVANTIAVVLIVTNDTICV